MDYEKKYKETLKRAKSIKDSIIASNNKESASYYTGFIDNIFPELKESEDERIREALVKYFEERNNYRDEDETFNGIPFPAVIAYLEKQKEQKPAEMDNEEIELSDFESELFSAFSDGWQQYLHGEEVDVAQWAKEHSTQLLNAAKQELKPAEWSKKDERMINEIITIMDGGKVTSGTYLSEYVAWLKSLRPQPHWKPSKEQMEALERCVDYLDESDNEDAAIIGSLCHDIKTLM